MNPSHTIGLLLGLAAAALAAAPARAQTPPPAGADEAGATLRRVDERRPSQPYRLWLGTVPAELTGSWEYSDETRRNFDLDHRRARDRRVREHEVKLEARLGLGPDLTAFGQLVALHETRSTQGSSGPQRTHELQRGELWLQWDRLGGTPWSLQLGRVPLLERRSLWWDDDLDALRLRHATPDWRLDTGLGRPLARVSSAESGLAADQRQVWRHWGQGGWTWAPRQHIEAFWLLQADRSGTPEPGRAVASGSEPDTQDLHARWLGLRASGQWRGAAAGPAWRLAYWADAVRLRGRETRTTVDQGLVGGSRSRRLRSWALDSGATLTLDMAWRPSLTLAHARGSGGEDSATLDANFRQTGLHENKVRLAGVKRLRRYGELLRPELSNLAVTTLAGGLRFGSNSSLELLLHCYRQLVPGTGLAAARLSAAPLGLDRRLGRELDLVIALREWSWLELTLRLSRFEPGAAFAGDRRDAAHALELGAALNF